MHAADDLKGPWCAQKVRFLHEMTNSTDVAISSGLRQHEGEGCLGLNRWAVSKPIDFAFTQGFKQMVVEHGSRWAQRAALLAQQA